VATTFLDLVASSTMSVLVENRGSWALADYWRPSIEEANSLGGWREERATQLWNGGTTTTTIAGERREDGELERILGLDELGENRNESYGGESTSGTIQEGGPPADGLLYALPYVGLQELLALEMVSKSLHDAVRGDVLLWQRLHVEAPLNKMLTNEALIQLAKRADGRLQSLSLVGCLRITDEAIEQVLASNPMLLKLSLPGCTRISAEVILKVVKAQTDCRMVGMPALKQLRIRGLYGVTREILDALQAMLQPEGAVQLQPAKTWKPQYYKSGHQSFACDEDKLIDVEACPKCGNARVVYDCTRDRCQPKQGMTLQQCRGCFLCIARCEECGTCINDSEFEETFCLDFVCSACWLRLPKCLKCNRPGCGRHASHLTGPQSSLICGDCQGVLPGDAGPEFDIHL
jgi:hypothetical protein